jgi:hypothetical protein
MCQKDLASYRLCLFLSRLNADEIVNNFKLAFTGQLYKKIPLENHLLFNITGDTIKPVSFFINLSSLEIR